MIGNAIFLRFIHLHSVCELLWSKSESSITSEELWTQYPIRLALQGTRLSSRYKTAPTPEIAGAGFTAKEGRIQNPHGAAAAHFGAGCMQQGWILAPRLHSETG